MVSASSVHTSARHATRQTGRPMREGAVWNRAVTSRTAGPSLPPELDHPFRLVALDWDGTAVVSRFADATRVVGLLDRLLGAGARIAVITGTSFDNVARQLGRGVAPEHARRFLI